MKTLCSWKLDIKIPVILEKLKAENANKFLLKSIQILLQ
jgi:hypothetical protein